MEAKELMIGDWVQNTNGNKGVVIGLKYYDSGEYEIVIRYNENSTCYSDPNLIQPIPLTAEILEKNGWSADTYSIFCLGKDKRLEYYHFENRLRLWWEGVDEWQSHYKVKDMIFQCHCIYVHQLQHALHLCGLNDLVDNFKI